MAMPLRANGRRDPGGIPLHALLLLSGGRLSAAALARRLGVSGITAKRLVADLRRRGYNISSTRLDGRSFYEVRDAPAFSPTDPFLTLAVRRPRLRPAPGKPEDSPYDTD